MPAASDLMNIDYDSPQVVHCKKAKYDVYIGRPTKWGNPFNIGPDGDRDEVIRKYHEWILTQPELMESLHELKGKVLGCWCAPKACHGHVLVALQKRVWVIDLVCKRENYNPEN